MEGNGLDVLQGSARCTRKSPSQRCRVLTCREVAKKSKLIGGQAVALQSGKARAAGSASKGPFTLKRCKTVKALVLGLSKAQPVKQA